MRLLGASLERRRDPRRRQRPARADEGRRRPAPGDWSTSRGSPELHGIRARGSRACASARSSRSRSSRTTRGRGRNTRALAQALDEAASPQIRNVATLGGNLCQRPRCWYFRGGSRPAGAGTERRVAVAGGRQPLPRDPRQRGPGLLRQPFDDGPRARRPRRQACGSSGPRGRASCRSRSSSGLRRSDERAGARPAAQRDRDGDRPPAPLRERRAPTTRCARRRRSTGPTPPRPSVLRDRPAARSQSARIVLGHVAPMPWLSRGSRAAPSTGKPSTRRPPRPPDGPRSRARGPCSGNATRSSSPGSRWSGRCSRPRRGRAA